VDPTAGNDTSDTAHKLQERPRRPWNAARMAERRETDPWCPLAGDRALEIVSSGLRPLETAQNRLSAPRPTWIVHGRNRGSMGHTEAPLLE